MSVCSWCGGTRCKRRADVAKVQVRERGCQIQIQEGTVEWARLLSVRRRQVQRQAEYE